ncbi:hypothetical protein VTL71DRAFT_13214 [Oculimacula yallundae]|uniref:Uncharacterized protein n=1 Tax=Oculimacula yallundae TaxID=86028 RepID=A0ABR4CJQ0_9HELO
MASLLLTTLLVSSVAHAADVGKYTYTLQPRLNSTAISQFNSTANSTTSRKVDSIIYDSPFNLTDLHPTYDLTLAISSHSTPNAPSSESTTSSLLFITPPTTAELGIRNGTGISSWDACAVVFKRVSDAATRRGENEDGGCFPTLGEKCIDALYKQVEDNTKISVSCGSLLMSIPPECSEAVVGDTTDFLGVDLNPSSTSNATLPLLLTESESHPSSNTSYYDEASHRIWPVLVFQRAESSGPNDQGNGATTKSIFCMRDQKATKSGSGSGTTSPTPKPTETGKPSAAIGLRSQLGAWGLVLGAVVGGLLMVV